MIAPSVKPGFRPHLADCIGLEIGIATVVRIAFQGSREHPFNALTRTVMHQHSYLVPGIYVLLPYVWLQTPRRACSIPT